MSKIILVDYTPTGEISKEVAQVVRRFTNLDVIVADPRNVKELATKTHITGHYYVITKLFDKFCVHVEHTSIEVSMNIYDVSFSPEGHTLKFLPQNGKSLVTIKQFVSTIERFEEQVSKLADQDWRNIKSQIEFLDTLTEAPEHFREWKEEPYFRSTDKEMKHPYTFVEMMAAKEQDRSAKASLSVWSRLLKF